MRTKLGLLVVVLAAVAGLLWSLGVGFPSAPGPVDAFRVRRGDLEVTLAVTGVVEARTVDLAFSVPGRLLRVAAEGEQVAAGQVVATLEAGELQADVEQARHAQRAAEEEVHRARAQVRASMEEVRRAAGAVQAALAQVQQAQANVGVARARLQELRATPRREDLQQAEAAWKAAHAAWEQARQVLQAQEELYRQAAPSTMRHGPSTTARGRSCSRRRPSWTACARVRRRKPSRPPGSSFARRKRRTGWPWLSWSRLGPHVRPRRGLGSRHGPWPLQPWSGPARPRRHGGLRRSGWAGPCCGRRFPLR